MKSNIKFKKILSSLLIVSALCSCCVSCEKQTAPNEATTDEQKIFEFEALTEIKENQPDIYVVLKVMTSQYWQDIIQGVKDAGIANKCNIYIGGVKTETDWDLQENLLRQAQAESADAILFAPANSSAFVNTAKSLKSDSIPLVLVDTMLTSAPYDVCYMTDNFQAGELAAQELISKLKKKYSDSDEVQVAIQTTTKNSQTIVDRIAGFNKYWVLNTPENWTVIDEIKFNKGDTDIAIQNGKDFLSKYPDLKAVVACNNSSAVGFAQALQDEGRKDIILSAFDYSDIVAEMIADNDWTVSTVVQKQYDMGYLGVEAALDILNGNPVEYKFVDTGVMVINEGNYLEGTSKNLLKSKWKGDIIKV